MEPVQLAAILAAVVVLASMVSVELGIAVALLELGFGVVVGNVFSLHSQEWLDFVASFASIVLTFLAGLEIEPGYFRERFAASVAIGLVSFAGPFLVGAGVTYLLLGLERQGSADRRYGAFDDLAGGDLCGAG
jgi:Kef-type K+ transport system membrane component KefB